MAGTFTTYAKISKQMSIVFTAYAEFALSLLGKQIPFLNSFDSICYVGEYINRIRNNKLIRYFHWRFYGLLQIWLEHLYTIFDCSGVRIPIYQRRFVFGHCWNKLRGKSKNNTNFEKLFKLRMISTPIKFIEHTKPLNQQLNTYFNHQVTFSGRRIKWNSCFNNVLLYYTAVICWWRGAYTFCKYWIFQKLYKHLKESWLPVIVHQIIPNNLLSFECRTNFKKLCLQNIQSLKHFSTH